MSLHTASKAVEQVRLNLPTLPTAEAAAGRWIVDNDHRMASMSMGQVAIEAGVSDTSVLRLCRRLGFSGFTDLKVRIIEDLARRQRTTTDEPQAAGTVAADIFEHCIQGLRDTLSVLGDELNAAAQQVAQCDQVLIVGVGTSIPVMAALHSQLQRLGVSTRMQNDSYLQRMEVALLPANSLVIAVSHSGASIDPVETLKLARRRELDTMCITGVANAPISAFAAVTLTSLSTEIRFEAVVGRVVQTALVSALARTYADLHPAQTAAAESAALQAVIEKTI